MCVPLLEGAFVSLLVSLELGCQFVYGERFDGTTGPGLLPVQHRHRRSLHSAVSRKRVAIVNDVISAGSAVRGTFFDLPDIGAEVVAIGALLALGDAMTELAHGHALPSNCWNACHTIYGSLKYVHYVPPELRLTEERGLITPGRACLKRVELLVLALVASESEEVTDAHHSSQPHVAHNNEEK